MRLPLRSWFAIFRQQFYWLQLELTTHCQAACIYCPHTLYRHHWLNQHLDPRVCQRLLPDLFRVNLVYLQGWGEPFLHPEFFRFVSWAKQAGCQVGTTTNGMLLDRERLSQLVAQEVDVVAFSLAGLEATNDRVRRGTRFATILEAIRQLQELKLKKGAIRPRIHVAYLLLRSGVAELSSLPEALAGLGVSQVVVSFLDFVATPALAAESLRLAPPEEYHEVKIRLEELVARGARLGFAVSHPFSYQPQFPTCPENPGRALSIAADGQVAPCVYLNLPVQGVCHQSWSGCQPYQRLTLGSLLEKNLAAIWRAAASREFFRGWARGQIPAECRACLKLKS